VVEPGFSDCGELATEPSAHHVHCDAGIGEVIDGCDLLGGERRVPRAGEESGDDLEGRGGREQGVAERHRLVLELGTIARGEADLAQCIVEA
jgi:hypothetical protein